MPDQEHKQYIDGKICEIKECPECEGSGEVLCGCDMEFEDDHNMPCPTCEGEGYIKK